MMPQQRDTEDTESTRHENGRNDDEHENEHGTTDMRSMKTTHQEGGERAQRGGARWGV